MDETESVPSTSQEDNEPQPSVNETTPARVNVPQGKKRRRKTEDTFEKELLSLLGKHSSESREPENPDRLFLLSLLPRVSDLNKTDKLDFKIKVMQLLQQYERGESLTIDSQPRLQTSPSFSANFSHSPSPAATSHSNSTIFTQPVDSEESVMSFFDL